MEPSELLRLAAQFLEQHRIEYLVTGSMASMAYGEPRFTNDIDIVVQLNAEQAQDLCDSFPTAEFYVNVDAAKTAARCHGQFNVIHAASGLKIDFMVAADDAFNKSRFSRSNKLNVTPSNTVSFAAPEDVIIRKLQYFREGGSDKHLRDIRGILKLTGKNLDQPYLNAWIDTFDLHDQWTAVLREH